MMKVSLIIALYNTEKYIEKCIQSVLDSPMSSVEYEIIVINDGSIDNSQAIVEKLIEANPNINIQLINKENGGQSSARNLGFAIAKGQYIFCLDSDDYINGDIFRQALDYAISKDLDMLPIDFSYLDEEYIPLNKGKDDYQLINNSITGVEFINKFIIAGTMWRYFYKSSIIQQNNLRLLEGVYHEDEEFVIKFLTYVKAIAYQKHKVYNYIIRENSTVNNKDMQHRKKLIFDIIIVVDKITELIENNVYNKGLIAGLLKKREQLIISIFIRMLKERFSAVDKQEVIGLLKSKDYLPVQLDSLNFKKRILGRIINIIYS